MLGGIRLLHWILTLCSIAFARSIDQLFGSCYQGGVAMGTDLSGAPGTDAKFWEASWKQFVLKGLEHRMTGGV
ncbi:MAG: hypothetical protein ACREV3_07020 [Gammaproteobacteria bacterium]